MIATWVIEPWESGYIGFTYPGLIGWVASVAWWFKRRDRSAPLRLQIVFAFEVAIGAVAAYIVGRLDASSYALETGSFDLSLNEANQVFMAKVALIGLGTHLVLLAITGILACLPSRKVPDNIDETAG